jgi:uncharacterized protein with HEPN domain
MRTDEERIQDILDAIGKIEQYTTKGIDAIKTDELVCIWVIHHLQIIGEASSNISKAKLKNYPSINWNEIKSFRNIVVHEYFQIELQEIWNTVINDLPLLKKALSEQ